ncbi:hypothetical protein LOTGIDRAFT_109890 [Lottia gigantea]|uniref:rRNA methyltransferase 2, mitochondrial n=1 Tax=Lottia gigantea TaxID=225164 RepID=V4B0Z9_LOTGI|nr:hypothetical protein LOTGIDRAFT_109890 [Lottia gigantea]ESP03933.1 hypothetical protein LOTGIDRAFT_109890 [Lottia gigantea]
MLIANFEIRKVCQRHLHLSKTVEKLKGKGKSSQEWLKRQASDPYVQKALDENYRCRSAFKLIEINDKYKILRPGQVVIDCGAAPGSWCQVAAQKVAKHKQGIGTVIGIDLQNFEPIDGVHVLSECDFTLPESQSKILDILNGQKADVILSDMAPNASGIKSMDHDVIIELCQAVLQFGLWVLKPGGTILCKLWMGANQKSFENDLKSNFESVKVVKPASSRSDSSEIFLLARNFQLITWPDMYK